VKAQELSRKYALAVFSLALEKWFIPLKAVQERLADNPKLLASLQDPARPFNDRQKEFDAIISAHGDQDARNFLYTLLKNDDLSLLANIIADLERLSRGGPQAQVARVTTAMALSDEDKDQFRQKLRQKYGETLEFVFNLDPAIIGGVVVQIGDKVMDASVATRLEAMGHALGVKH
jgi:F-type H+-transporting ATPase subunit delta